MTLGQSFHGFGPACSSAIKRPAHSELLGASLLLMSGEFATGLHPTPEQVKMLKQVFQPLRVLAHSLQGARIQSSPCDFIFKY